MCGLCGFVIRDADIPQDARDRLADSLLLGVDHRGGDATGLLAIAPGSDWLLKAAIPASRFIAGRPRLPKGTRAMIGHTRLATQGGTEWGFNNHPVRVGDTYLAHNGHVANQREIAEKVGGAPVHGVDSALLAALVDHSAGPVEALEAFDIVRGAAAVTYYNPAKAPGVVVLARINLNPLYVWRGRRAIVWASTQAAVVGAWKEAFRGAGPDPAKVLPLDEGEALIIHPDGRAEGRRFARSDYSYINHYTRSWKPWKPEAPKGKGKGKGKGAPAGAPTPRTALPATLLPDVLPLAGFRWDDDGAMIPTDVESWDQCDACSDHYTRLQKVVIGGETFAMCASCATWAEREEWGTSTAKVGL